MVRRSLGSRPPSLLERIRSSHQLAFNSSPLLDTSTLKPGCHYAAALASIAAIARDGAIHILLLSTARLRRWRSMVLITLMRVQRWKIRFVHSLFEGSFCRLPRYSRVTMIADVRCYTIGTLVWMRVLLYHPLVYPRHRHAACDLSDRTAEPQAFPGRKAQPKHSFNNK